MYKYQILYFCSHRSISFDHNCVSAAIINCQSDKIRDTRKHLEINIKDIVYNC